MQLMEHGTMRQRVLRCMSMPNSVRIIVHKLGTALKVLWVLKLAPHLVIKRRMKKILKVPKMAGVRMEKE